MILSVEGELYDEIKRVNTDWIIQFYSDMLEYMKSHMKLGNLLSKENLKEMIFISFYFSLTEIMGRL